MHSGICACMLAYCQYVLIQDVHARWYVVLTWWHAVHKCWHFVHACWHVVHAWWHGLSSECYRYIRNVVHVEFDTDHPHYLQDKKERCYTPKCGTGYLHLQSKYNASLSPCTDLQKSPTLTCDLGMAKHIGFLKPPLLIQFMRPEPYQSNSKSSKGTCMNCTEMQWNWNF